MCSEAIIFHIPLLKRQKQIMQTPTLAPHATPHMLLQTFTYTCVIFVFIPSRKKLKNKFVPPPLFKDQIKLYPLSFSTFKYISHSIIFDHSLIWRKIKRVGVHVKVWAGLMLIRCSLIMSGLQVTCSYYKWEFLMNTTA